MITRILRIELRRSFAPWLALLLLGLGAAMLYFTTDRQALWFHMSLQQRGMLGVLWPLALGAGALQAGRERRSSMEELVSTTARPRSRRVVPTAVAMAIGGVAGYLGWFAAGAGYVIPDASYFPAGLLPLVAVGALATVAAVWLGLAVGSRLPSPLVPPVLVVGGAAALLALFFLSTQNGGDPPGTFLFLPALRITNGFEAEFVTVTARANLAQGIWMAGLAATGLLAFAAAGRRGRMLALLPAILAAVVALPLQPRQLSGAFALDEAAVAQVCTPDSPRVCVTRVHAPVLDDLRGPAREALALLSAKLPNAPTSAAEEYRNLFVPGPPPPSDILWAPLQISNTGRSVYSGQEILWSLLDGAGTPFCVRDPGIARDFDRYLNARLVAAAWLMDQPPPATLHLAQRTRDFDLAPILEALRTLRGLPAGEQRARVAAFREAELRCDGRDHLDILVGPGGVR
jgi:hypothetical protein